MSLIHFHRLLIAAAILFCAGYGLWEMAAFVEDGGATSLLVALGFLAASAGLGYYLRHLPRFLGLPEDRRR